MTVSKKVMGALLLLTAATVLLSAAFAGSEYVDGEPDKISGSGSGSDITVQYDGTAVGGTAVRGTVKNYSGGFISVVLKDSSSATVKEVLGFMPTSTGTDASFTIPATLSFGVYTVAVSGSGISWGCPLNVSAQYYIKYLDGTTPLPGSGYVGHGVTPSYSPPPKIQTDVTYTFAGWNETLVPAAPGGATYTAKWNPAPTQYKITLETGGGTIASPAPWTGGPSTYTQYIGYGAPIVLPAIERTGYDLDPASWPTGDLVTGDKTYTAKWTVIPGPVSHTVTLDPAGGTTASPGSWSKIGSVYRGTFIDGSSLGAVPVFSRTGYTFSSWSPALPANVTASATYTAQWTPNTYTLTLDLDGGTVSSPGAWTQIGSDYSRTLPYGTSVGSVPTPSKAGFTFNGWAPALSASTPVPALNQTYTAQWTVPGGTSTPTTYTVTINPDGGTISDGDWTKNGTVYRKVFSDGAPLGTIPVPTKAGFAFAGWSSVPSQIVTGSITYTALWTELPSSVTVHITTGPNGTVASSDMTVAAGGDIEILVSPASGYVIDEVTTEWEYEIDGNRIILRSVGSDSNVGITFKEEQSSGFPWWIVAAILAVLVLLLFIFWMSRKRENSTS